MLMVMLVSLYTVRVVLQTIGVEDYGIYNVVGGVMSMLTFVTSTMSSASIRFFSFELGRQDYDRLNKYFNVSVRCYIYIAIVIILLAETVGLWFVKTQLTIPPARIQAAIWVYQCSAVSFVLNVLMIPYSSLILAREKMSIYAYVGIGEVILNLLIVYALVLVSVDKLILYAILKLLITLCNAVFYIIYSSLKFKETKLIPYTNRVMTLEVLNFSGWNLLGAMANVLCNQGINVLLNIFFNPIVNAARAIAYQINGVVSTFVTNFYSAVRPQITKQYAAHNLSQMMDLVFMSSRLCYFLSMIFVIPLMIEAPQILKIWLQDVPEYTVVFTRLVLGIALVEAIGYPFHASVAATGHIKYYQIVVSSFYILTIPISFMLLKLGYSPETVMIVSIITAILAQISRIYFMSKLLGMQIYEYATNVISRILVVTLLTCILTLFIKTLLDEGILNMIILIFSSICISILSIYLLGITKSERVQMNEYLISKVKRNNLYMS